MPQNRRLIARLHRRLILVLAEVHQLGDGRLGGGGDLNQIQIGFTGQSHGVLDADDADLLARRPDKADLGDANLLIDAWIADALLLR